MASAALPMYDLPELQATTDARAVARWYMSRHRASCAWLQRAASFQPYRRAVAIRGANIARSARIAVRDHWLCVSFRLQLAALCLPRACHGRPVLRLGGRKRRTCFEPQDAWRKVRPLS